MVNIKIADEFLHRMRSIYIDSFNIYILKIIYFLSNKSKILSSSLNFLAKSKFGLFLQDVVM